MTIKTFIDRPLLSIVINVIVVSLGVIALTRLPIEKYPDIAPPTVYLSSINQRKTLSFVGEWSSLSDRVCD